MPGKPERSRKIGPGQPKPGQNRLQDAMRELDDDGPPQLAPEPMSGPLPEHVQAMRERGIRAAFTPEEWETRHVEPLPVDAVIAGVAHYDPEKHVWHVELEELTPGTWFVKLMIRDAEDQSALNHRPIVGVQCLTVQGSQWSAFGTAVREIARHKLEGRARAFQAALAAQGGR